MTVQPAYGRDYSSKAKVLADWNNNKDFQIVGIHRDSGRMVNKSDVEKSNEPVTIRYSKLRKALVI